FEIRNTFKTRKREAMLREAMSSMFWSFGFRICFGFRVSYFGFGRVVVEDQLLEHRRAEIAAFHLLLISDLAKHARRHPFALDGTRHKRFRQQVAPEKLIDGLAQAVFDAAADLADAAQLALLIAGNDEAAKIVRRFSGETDDGTEDFRLAFDLEPGVVALTGHVTAVEAFGDHSLQVLANGFREIGTAFAYNTLRELQIGVAHRFDQLTEAGPAFAQRLIHPRFVAEVE